MTKLLATLAARCDGLAMLALAGFMGWLATAGNYWMYLNPKFKPVTLAAAVVLAVLAVPLWRLVRHSRRRGSGPGSGPDVADSAV